MKKITVTQNKTAPMEDFYGIFFEDINHAADGGLYAEKIRNRAFEFSPIDNPSYQALTAWKKIEEGGASVSACVSNKSPYSDKNPNYLTLDISETGERAGIKNLGYGSGIALEKDAAYVFSCFARADRPCAVKASLDDAYGGELAHGTVEINSTDWTRYSLRLVSPVTETSACLALTADERCKFSVDFVSLFPEDTYKNRENGMRRDIAEMLAALKPKFMRFPGGCLIHDGTLNKDDRNSMYRWKNTIGDITRRSSRRNNWRYNQSLGIGYYEYFLFCEDIGAKPLPVLPAGYNPHMEQAVPMDELGEWIDDALDLIEFANGGIDTHWGGIRAELGHEAPFGLEYLAIGNEEVGKGFWERYDAFHRAVKDKYPEIKIINSAGPFPAGSEFERGWENARKNGSDLIDEHYYTSPEWMIANIRRYDGYGTDVKVFVGEYASWGNTYYNALAEAAYMTGLENNADKVGLVCYAPLLAHTDYVDWKPDMIWFDNHRVYGSANYYVQKMFMTNTGKNLLEVKKEGFAPPKAEGEDKINGGAELSCDRCCAVFRDITLTDMESGKTERLGDISLDGTKKVSLPHMDSVRWRISFKAKRLSGNTGFRLDFGKKSEDTYIRWFIGGWSNQDSEINSIINGRGSSLDHTIFSVMTGREYECCLETDGRRITASIDGRVMNRANDKLPCVEDIYVTASADDEYTYLKAVNIKNTSVTAAMTIEGMENISASVLTMTAAPEDMNSFEEPQKVSPRRARLQCDKDGFEYTFPPSAITVFKIENTPPRNSR